MADMSLDDIIKKKKPQSTGMKGRGGGVRKGTVRGGARPNVASRGGRVSTKPVADARFKIIQKNREKLTDARDKLAEIAKQSDARLKLDKIRASHVKKPASLMSGISRKTGRNGKISLSTNKIPKLIPSYEAPMAYPPVPRSVGYRPALNEPQYLNNMGMDYMEDDYMIPAPPLRRTVSNDYAPSLPPPPPVFEIKSNQGYSWQQMSNNVRNVSMRKTEQERHRDFKVVARAPMSQKSEQPLYRNNWSFPTKSRTILADDPEDKYFNSRSNQRDMGVKSRLEAVSNKPRSMGIMSRTKPPSSSSTLSASTGYRIVVSNLQANVTQEDIKELFEDVGELLVSRLVRPGTAEVIYKTLKDATKAVETYHNRQLDGHPMKCLLVNPRPKNNPTAPAVRPLTDSRRTASSSYVQPSLGAVQRALFDD